MADVFLLLGSNLGNRQLFMQQAVSYIGNDISPVVKTSALYQTQAWGNTDAPDYLNQVIMLQTDMPALQILETVLEIEQKLGRERYEKWGPRVIDIDILFYGNQVIDEHGLQIPHPRLHQRRFTLEPLAQIAPQFMHPVINKTVLQLTTELNDELIVKKL